MANTTSTPNMNLVVPNVGPSGDPGPDWANNLNADLGLLDQHNHSNGQGVQITPSGINVSSDLPFNGNNATLLKTIRFSNQSASIPGTSPNLGCLYELNNELYYNDGVGNVVKVTSSGSVNATSSGITNGTATASFTGGVLIVNSNTNTPANIQAASVLVGNNVSASNFATVNAPSSLAASYSLTLPPSNTSGSTVFVTYDTSNNLGVGYSITQLFQNFTSSQVNTTSSNIASNSFVTFSNSPALTITPLITGPYKVYASVPVGLDTAAKAAIVRIYNTSGSATLLSESQAVFAPFPASSLGSIFVQSTYTLTGGTSYVFDIQGYAGTGCNLTCRGDVASFYMYAEL